MQLIMRRGGDTAALPSIFAARSRPANLRRRFYCKCSSSAGRNAFQGRPVDHGRTKFGAHLFNNVRDGKTVFFAKTVDIGGVLDELVGPTNADHGGGNVFVREKL